MLTEIDDSSKDILRVAEKVQNIPSDNLCRWLLVSARSSYHPSSLVLGQPCRLIGKIRDEEKCSEADENGQDAFKDENPSPITVAADTVHFGDRTREEAAKRTGDQNRAPIKGEPLLGFLTLVPETDEVVTCGGS